MATTSGAVSETFLKSNRYGTWGNYDLTRDAGYVTASRGLVAADILAARMQGQDVHQSAFFDVVREELGWDVEAAEEPLPEEVRTIFA